MEWTKSEKRALLQALHENGSSDINYLASVLPLRTIYQIRLFISSYKVLAKESLEKREKKPETKLEDWRSYMKMKGLKAPRRHEYKEHLVSRVIKYIDYFEKKSLANEGKNHNINMCYEYLVSLLNGDVPKPMPSNCKMFIFENLKKLGNELTNSNISAENICSFANKANCEEETNKTCSANESGHFLIQKGMNPFNIPIHLLQLD